MIYKTYKNNTYNIYTVKTNKFKTCHMEIVFRNNIDKNTITKRSMITEMLVENSNKYKTRQEMIIELENLYNSFFYGVTNKVGKSIITSFCFDFINPKLVNEKIDEFIKFPLINILNPNIKDNEFDINTFEYIKERIKKDIESIIENPKSYSIQKLLNNMCKDSETSININGYIEDLETINPSNLYEYYKNMIEHDYIDIYIIGDLDMDKVVKIIKNTFKINILKDHKIEYIINNSTSKKEKIKHEEFDTTQENIAVGLNVINPTDYEQNYVGHIYNMILGAGSLDTKLYNRLRNDNSLCYNCSSLYQKYDNLIIIHTAISKENECIAIKLIKEALNDMIDNITEDEINNAKELLITTLNMSLDVPGRIIDNYIFKNLYNLDEINVRIENYKNVSKEQIIEFAKKIKINTILCLRDGENEKD